MNDWQIQFTSSLAAAVAFALTAWLTTLVWRRVRTYLRTIWARFVASVKPKETPIVARPTEREVKSLSRRLPVGEREFLDAIDFLKNLRANTSEELNSADIPEDWFGRHLSRWGLTYQEVMQASAAVYLVGALTQVYWLTVTSVAIWVVAFAWVLFAFALSILHFLLYLRKTKRLRREWRRHFQEAMSVIAPSVSLSYSQMGEFTKGLDDKQMGLLQAELGAAGLPFQLRDLEMARFLANADQAQIEEIGFDIEKKLGIFDQLPHGDRVELAVALVNVMRETVVSPTLNKGEQAS